MGRQCRVGASPYRKLSSASARGPGQLESGGHLGSGSTWECGLQLCLLWLLLGPQRAVTGDGRGGVDFIQGGAMRREKAGARG